jgi:hypothetical protein
MKFGSAGGFGFFLFGAAGGEQPEEAKKYGKQERFS